MKIHLVLGETWPSMKKAVEDARAFFAIMGVTITTENKKVDASSGFLYDTAISWNKLKFEMTKSLAPGYVFGLASWPHPVEADCIGLMVDKAKTDEDANLLGQQSTLGIKQIIEVYASNGNGKDYGFARDSYTLIHEIFHALADHHGYTDLLHEYLDDSKNRTLEALKWDVWGRMNSKSQWGLLPAADALAKQVVEYAASIGDPIKIIEGHRSPERQNELAKQRPKVTNAKAWESMHQYRIAFDYCFTTGEAFPPSGDKRWKKINQFAKKIGLYSYGLEDNFDDGHLQLTFNYSEKQIREGKVDWTRWYAKPKSSKPSFDGSIVSVQKILKHEGFFPDGVEYVENHGPLTRAGLVQYQKKYAIFPAWGNLGPLTRAHLREHYP